MHSIGLAILSACVFALVILLVKYISKHKVKDAHSFFFWTHITGLPFVLCIPILFGFQFSWSFLIPIIVHSILLTSGQLLFTKGLYLVDTSVIGPLFQLQSAFIVVLAALFLGETYPLGMYFFVLLMLLGVMLVSVTDKTALTGLSQPGVRYIIGMQLLHAGANIAVGYAVKYTSNWQVLFYSFMFNSLLVAGYSLLKKVKIDTSAHTIRWMTARAVLLLIATGLLYKAFESNVTISASFGLLSSPIVFVVSILSAWFFPNMLEKQSRKTYAIRAAGMVIILVSAWQIMQLK